MGAATLVLGVRCPDAGFHHRGESDIYALKQTNEMEAGSESH
jgi:hypothetical protein